MQKHHKIIVGILLAAGLGFSVWSFLYTRKVARAYSLDRIVVDPVRPLPPQEPPEEVLVDARIRELEDRGDGARLFLTPAPDEAILRAGFSDNGTIVISATATREDGDVSRVFSLHVKDRLLNTYLESEDRIFSSSHRPANKNADALCYSSDATGVFEITCTAYDGGEAELLTEHEGAEYLMEPATSPDGAWLAFEVKKDHLRKPEGSSVWKIGMNRSGIRQLTRGADDRFPTWSHDGKQLFFQRRAVGGNWDIFVMKSDGSNPTPVMRTYDDNEMWPVMLDETTLVTAVGPKDEPTRIKSLDTVTKAGTWLTSGAYGNETFPSVSPDGKLISFLAPVSPEEPERLGVWLLEADL